MVWFFFSMHAAHVQANAICSSSGQFHRSVIVPLLWFRSSSGRPGQTDSSAHFSTFLQLVSPEESQHIFVEQGTISNLPLTGTFPSEQKQETVHLMPNW